MQFTELYSLQSPSVSPFQPTPLLAVLPLQLLTLQEMPPLLLLQLPSLALLPSDPLLAAAPLLLLFLLRSTASLLATGRATLVTLQRVWNRTASRRR